MIMSGSKGTRDSPAKGFVAPQWATTPMRPQQVNVWPFISKAIEFLPIIRLSIIITFSLLRVQDYCFHLYSQWNTKRKTVSLGSLWKFKAHSTFGRSPISDVTAGVFHCPTKAKTPAVTSPIGAWPQEHHARQFHPSEEKRFFVLFKVDVKQFEHINCIMPKRSALCSVTKTQSSLLQTQKSRTLMAALNIRWNLIYFKSQGNQSLLGVHCNHLQEGMWYLRKDHRCRYHINTFPGSLSETYI